MTDTATIADVLTEARRVAAGAEPAAADLPWDTAPIGVFGEARTRTDVPEHGDRIELYRPLKVDPRQRRREQVQRERKRR